MDLTDDRLGPTLAELQAAYEKRTLVDERWYRNQTIKLDGYHFKGCLFESCVLWYEAEDFELEDCALGGKVTFRHGRPPA